MNLAKALKQKNLLVKEYGQLFSILHRENSIVVGNTRKYDISDIRFQIASKMEEILALKMQIAIANQPIQASIFRMAELKNLASQYSSMSTNEGKHGGGYRGDAEMYECFIDSKAKDAIVKGIEIQIQDLQDSIDTFNHSTELPTITTL